MKYIQRIPFSEFTFEVMRSRGPGGQHVNRTNSAVQLRWQVATSKGFSVDELEVLKRMLNTTADGDVLVRSESSRSQDQNKSECLNKLDLLLQKAFFVPKKRRATRPTKGSKIRKRESKERHSEIKKVRKKVSF